jgi:Uma2 family endonuclease
MPEAPALPVRQSWTFEDVEALPDGGYRYEVIDGNLIASPAPTPRHQKITYLLNRLLGDAAPDALEVIPAAGLLRGRRSDGILDPRPARRPRCRAD